MCPLAGLHPARPEKRGHTLDADTGRSVRLSVRPAACIWMYVVYNRSCPSGVRAHLGYWKDPGDGSRAKRERGPGDRRRGPDHGGGGTSQAPEVGVSPSDSAIPALTVFPASLGPRTGAELWEMGLDPPRERRETQVLPPYSALMARLAGRRHVGLINGIGTQSKCVLSPTKSPKEAGICRLDILVV